MGELSQQREHFVEKLRVRFRPFNALNGFIQSLQSEMAEGNLRPVAPHQLMLSVIGMVVFPFMAKPVFQTLMEVEEPAFKQLMHERKAFVMDFLRHALIKCDHEK